MPIESEKKYPASGKQLQADNFVQEAEFRQEKPAREKTPAPYYSPIWSPDQTKSARGKTIQATYVERTEPTIAKYFGQSSWMVLDFLIGICAILVGFALSPHYHFNLHLYYSTFIIVASLIFSISLLISGVATGLYEKSLLVNRSQIVLVSIISCMAAVGLSALFFNFILYRPIGRLVLLITFATSFAAITLSRLKAHESFLLNKTKIIIVSDLREAIDIYNSIMVGARKSIYQILGTCVTDAEFMFPPGSDVLSFEKAKLLLQTKGNDDNLKDCGILCSISDLEQTCRELKADKIIVGNSYKKNMGYFSHIINCVPNGCRIMTWDSFNEEVLRLISLEHLTPDWFYSANLNVNHPILLIFKRGLDLFIASLGLLIGLPFMLLIALMVKLTSKGPVLYRQLRTGRFGRIFSIYKFRTMIANAENGNAQWASENDSRVTFIGRILRKSRLDELPQLWNVLKGEMSFVGPRPERPEFISTLVKEIPYYDMRHIVPPGLTGFAQVNYRYGANVEDAKRKLQYDLYYIKNFSILLDLQIILRTFAVMMRGSR